MAELPSWLQQPNPAETFLRGVDEGSNLAARAQQMDIQKQQLDMQQRQFNMNQILQQQSYDFNKAVQPLQIISAQKNNELQAVNLQNAIVQQDQAKGIMRARGEVSKSIAQFLNDPNFQALPIEKQQDMFMYNVLNIPFSEQTPEAQVFGASLAARQQIQNTFELEKMKVASERERAQISAGGRIDVANINAQARIQASESSQNVKLLKIYEESGNLEGYNATLRELGMPEVSSLAQASAATNKYLGAAFARVESELARVKARPNWTEINGKLQTNDVIAESNRQAIEALESEKAKLMEMMKTKPASNAPVYRSSPASVPTPSTTPPTTPPSTFLPPLAAPLPGSQSNPKMISSKEVFRDMLDKGQLQDTDWVSYNGQVIQVGSLKRK